MFGVYVYFATLFLMLMAFTCFPRPCRGDSAVTKLPAKTLEAPQVQGLGPRRTTAPIPAEQRAAWTKGADGRMHAPLKKQPAPAKSPLPDLKPEDAIIIVNGESLTWGAMLRHAELMIAEIRLPAGVTAQDFAEERDTILMRRIMILAKNHITKTLLAQEARRHQLAISPQEVASKQEEVFAQVRKNRRSPEPHISEFSSPGSYFMTDLTNSLLAARLRTEVIRPAAQITDEDIQNAIRQRVEDNQKSAVYNDGLRPKLEGLLKQIKAGESFATLAFRESDCDSSFEDGLWGTFKRDDLRAEIADVAFEMEEDALSDVIETPFSFHIIKLHKKNRGFQAEGANEQPPVVSVRISHIMLEKKAPLPLHTTDTARQELLDQREAEALETLNARLLNEAKIETPLPLY